MVGIELYLSKYIVIVNKDLGYRAFITVLYLELFPLILPLGVFRRDQCSKPLSVAFRRDIPSETILKTNFYL